MKITKKYFLSNISPVLTNDHITTIKSKDINEFKIGKNFFYEQLNPEIIKIQSWLNSHFQDNIDLNDSAVAFRKECSYLDLFEPHRKNYYFLRLDIKSFFHNIQVQDIKKTFSNYFENEYVDSKRRQTLLNGFINLVTFKVPKKFHNEDFRKKESYQWDLSPHPLFQILYLEN